MPEVGGDSAEIEIELDDLGIKAVAIPVAKKEEITTAEILVVEEKTQEIEIVEEESGCGFCPQRAFPAEFERVRISSIIRFIAIGVTLAIIVLAVILSVIPDSPVNDALELTLNWIDSIPLGWQILAVLALYYISTPFGMPITPINVASGFFFGFFLGVGVALVGVMGGAMICFVWGKTVLNSYVNKKMNEHRKLRAACFAVKKQAIKLIVLTHLSPIVPSALLHYSYAAVGVPVVRFFVGTTLGVSPFVLIYVYIGSVSRGLTSALSGGNSSMLKEVLWLGLIVFISVVIFIVVTLIAKRELDRALAEMEEAQKPAELIPDDPESIPDDPENAPPVVLSGLDDKKEDEDDLVQVGIDKLMENEILVENLHNSLEDSVAMNPDIGVAISKLEKLRNYNREANMGSDEEESSEIILDTPDSGYQGGYSGGVQDIEHHDESLIDPNDSDTEVVISFEVADQDVQPSDEFPASLSPPPSPRENLDQDRT